MSVEAHRRRHVTRLDVVDLTPRWKVLMPILISAIENGTETGRENARRNLHKLADKVDSAQDLQRRVRAALDRLTRVWPTRHDALSPEERAALAEAIEVLTLTAADVVRVTHPEDIADETGWINS
jgi:hypothetical protein